MKRRSLVAGATGLAASFALPAARAQGAAYPAKPVKMIVPHSPGTSPDVVARLVGDRLAQAIGQPVVIDNRAGAGGMMGAEQAAALPADGYNLLFTVKGVVAIGPHLYTNARYNPPKDYRSITEILVVPHIITANNNTPYNTLGEMVDYAKKNPGKIDYASTGVGSQPHVALETWARRLGIKLTHIPYKANPSPDVMSGVVSLYLEAATVSLPSVKAGRIKALAVSGTERLPGLPNVPTVSEFNAELDPNGIIGNSWHGVFTPTGTPDDIVNRLNTELVKIVRTEEMQTRLRSLGLTPTGTTSAALAAKLDADYAYWGKLIKELDIKVE
ncbi:MAG: tripartite tricarboxylate transporter substrate binding protein [Pseudomonadota bacterium]